MEALSPLHPRLVHFPIALLLTGVFLIVPGLLLRRVAWSACGRLILLLGWISAPVAALVGMVDQSRAPVIPVVTQTINQHITAGIALIVVFGLALYWPLRDKALLADGRGRGGYLALLLLGAALVIVEAGLGGLLVYKLGVGVQ